MIAPEEESIVEITLYIRLPNGISLERVARKLSHILILLLNLTTIVDFLKVELKLVFRSHL